MLAPDRGIVREALQLWSAFCFVQGLPNDPKRPARSGPFAGLIQNDGEVPAFFASLIAGGVCYQDLPALYSPQDDEVTAGSKVAFRHDSNHQLAAAESVQDTLRLGGCTALHWEPPRFGRVRNQGMVGTAFAAPAAVLIGPLRHLHRVNDVVCQRGYHDGHRGGAAAIAADVVCAIGLIGILLVQLVEIDHIRDAIRKADIPQGGNGSAAVVGLLEHPIAQE